MFSGMLASFLKVAAIAVVTGGLAGGVIWAAQTGSSEDGASGAQAEASATVSVTPAPPTPTALPPTQPPPTQAPPTAPPPTVVPPAPTLDTRVAIRDLPTLDQIQLRKDGKYFIADRGDGCTWVEVFRGTITFRGEEILDVILQTDCPVDFTYAFWPEKGEVNVQVW